MSRWFGLYLLVSVSFCGCKKEVLPEAAGAASGEGGRAVGASAPSPAIDPAVSALAASFAPGEQRVTLVSKGAKPRKPLRYAYAQGTAGSLQVKIVSDIGAGILHPTSRQPIELLLIIMPSALVEFEMSAKSVDADDNLVLVSKVSAAGIEDRPGSMLNDVALAERRLAMLMGVTSQATLSPTGRLIQQEITPSNPVSPDWAETLRMAETLRLAEQAAQHLSVPLPDESIGLGAQWTVMSVGQQSGMEVLVTQTGTLASLEGDVATIRFTITKDLINDDGKMTDIPPELTPVFTQFDCEGAGQLRVDLSQPLVLSGETVLTLQAGFDITLFGEPQSATSSMRTETKTVGTPR